MCVSDCKGQASGTIIKQKGGWGSGYGKLCNWWTWYLYWGCEGGLRGDL